jgi:hypothetical protein
MGRAPSTLYTFRYRARNIFGWSDDYSDVATIATIIAPEAMDPSQVTSSVVGTNLVLAWTAPDENGSQILEYEVYFAESTASEAAFTKMASYCVGLVYADCTVPMDQFWASNTDTVYSFVQGEAVRVKVASRNAVGWSELGEEATGSLVQTVPETPTAAPTRNDGLTSELQVTIDIAEITSPTYESGYATITSYDVEWNEGSGTDFVSIQGSLSDTLNRQVTVTDGEGVVSGT